VENLPTKWSHVNQGTGTNQGQSASQSPMFQPLRHIEALDLIVFQSQALPHLERPNPISHHDSSCHDRCLDLNHRHSVSICSQSDKSTAQEIQHNKRFPRWLEQYVA